MKEYYINVISENLRISKDWLVSGVGQIERSEEFRSETYSRLEDNITAPLTRNLDETDVKAIRKKLGYTQNQLADAMGVTLRTVQTWEYNERNISKSSRLLLKKLLYEHGSENIYGSQDSKASKIKESQTEYTLSLHNTPETSQTEHILSSQEVDLMDKSEVISIRKKLGYTQSQLAKAMGVTLGTVQTWEYGRTNISGPAKLLLKRLLAEKISKYMVEDSQTDTSMVKGSKEEYLENRQSGSKKHVSEQSLSGEEIEFVLHALTEHEQQLLKNNNYSTWKKNVRLEAQNEILQKVARMRLENVGKLSK